MEPTINMRAHLIRKGDPACVTNVGASLPMSGYSDIKDSKEKYKIVQNDEKGKLSSEEFEDENKLSQNDLNNHSVNKCVYKCKDSYLDKFSRVSLDDSIQFDSHFESANLHSAYRVFESIGVSTSVQQMEHAYDLYMSFDLNSSGSNLQWFYFKVSNLKAGQVLKFNIKNYRKANSLFRCGMRPLVYSETERKWSRDISNVTYKLTSDSNGSEFQNMLDDQYYWNGCELSTTRTNSDDSGAQKEKPSQTFYTLSFTYDVKVDDDIVYFAFSYPYSYSLLQRFIGNIETDPLRTSLMRRRLLCKTIAGNRCDVLTITAPASSSDELCRRPVVIITARVHPGETHSSLIAHGLVDFLTRSHCDEAKQLRARYIFKIIPMLNPDGVINGCYRSSLAGCDLNRVWRNPDESLHPTLFHTKAMIRRLQRNHSIALLVDLHGHSAQRGILTYGCLAGRRIVRTDFPPIDPIVPASTSQFRELSRLSNTVELASTLSNRSITAVHVQHWRAMLFPSLLGRISPAFTISRCSYNMQRAKAGSMRLAAFLEMGIDNAYTLEASMAGDAEDHFTAQDLYDFGEQLGRSLCVYYPSVAGDVHDPESFKPMLQLVRGMEDDTLIQMMMEMIVWRRYYDPRVSGQGILTLTDRAIADFNSVTPDSLRDDSDDDDEAAAANRFKKTKSRGSISDDVTIHSAASWSLDTPLTVDLPNQTRASVEFTPRDPALSVTTTASACSRSSTKPPLMDHSTVAKHSGRIHTDSAKRSAHIPTRKSTPVGHNSETSKIQNRCLPVQQFLLDLSSPLSRK